MWLHLFETTDFHYLLPFSIGKSSAHEDDNLMSQLLLFWKWSLQIYKNFRSVTSQSTLYISSWRVFLYVSVAFHSLKSAILIICHPININTVLISENYIIYNEVFIFQCFKKGANKFIAFCDHFHYVPCKDEFCKEKAPLMFAALIRS